MDRLSLGALALIYPWLGTDSCDQPHHPAKHKRACPDYQPVPFDITPFRYEIQGHPEIVEFPIHGWQDVHWKMVNGWEKTAEYLDFLKKTVDEVADEGLLWSYGTHDWSSIREDPEMKTIRGLIEYALERGLEIVDYRTYYERMGSTYDRSMT